MNEVLEHPSLALSPPCCVAHRSRSFGYAPSSRLAWRRNGGGLMFNNFIHGALGQQEITSSSQLFTITVTERKPLFAMRFQEYEPNGNALEGQWAVGSSSGQ
jgi:hypothetical protein